MTDLDLTRYEGHTPGPWNAQDHEDELLIFAPRHGRLGETLATLQVSDLPSSRFQKEQQQANARLIADAPLLLAEVKRLDLEHKAAERELLWVRQSHARLLEAIKADAYRIMRDGSLCWCEPTSDPHEWWCVDIRAAVAEAEALNAE